MVGGQAVVERCTGPGVEQLLPGLLIAVALLLPDITEVGFPGLASIRFRLDRQMEQQEELKSQIADLTQQTLVSQSTQVSAPNYIIVDAASLQADLAKKETEFLGHPEQGGAAAVPTPPDDPTAGEEEERTKSTAENAEPTLADLGQESEGQSERESQSRAQLTVELLQLWQRRLLPWVEIGSRMPSKLWRGLIRRYVSGSLTEAQEEKFGSRLRNLVPPNLGEEGLEIVSRWYGVFREEIEFVRGTRNQIAHPDDGIDLDSESIKRAVEIGDRLATLIEEELAALGVLDVDE